MEGLGGIWKVGAAGTGADCGVGAEGGAEGAGAGGFVAEGGGMDWVGGGRGVGGGGGMEKELSGEESNDRSTGGPRLVFGACTRRAMRGKASSEGGEVM